MVTSCDTNDCEWQCAGAPGFTLPPPHVCSLSHLTTSCFSLYLMQQQSGRGEVRSRSTTFLPGLFSDVRYVLGFSLVSWSQQLCDDALEIGATAMAGWGSGGEDHQLAVIGSTRPKAEAVAGEEWWFHWWLQLGLLFLLLLFSFSLSWLRWFQLGLLMHKKQFRPSFYESICPVILLESAQRSLAIGSGFVWHKLFSSLFSDVFFSIFC
jgi:hypothetical protein